MFKEKYSSKKQKIVEQVKQILRQNVSWKTLLLKGFILRPTKRPWVRLKMLPGSFKIAFRRQDRHIFM